MRVGFIEVAGDSSFKDQQAIKDSKDKITPHHIAIFTNSGKINCMVGPCQQTL